MSNQQYIPAITVISAIYDVFRKRRYITIALASATSNCKSLTTISYETPNI